MGNEKTVSGLANAVYYVSLIIKIGMIILAVLLLIGLLFMSLIPSKAMEVYFDLGVTLKLDETIFTDEIINSSFGEMKDVVRDGNTFIFPGERVSFSLGMVAALLAATLLGAVLNTVLFTFVCKYAKLVQKAGTMFINESIAHLRKIGIMLLVAVFAPELLSGMVTSSSFSMSFSSGGANMDLTYAVIILAYVLLVYTVKQGISARERAISAEKQLFEIDEINRNFDLDEDNEFPSDNTDTDSRDN